MSGGGWYGWGEVGLTGGVVMALERRGVLYLVGTPIGNLGDWSARACELLRAVDVVAAEDTREARKLFNHFGIETPLVSYHAHNARAKESALLARLQRGEAVAVISDAGMPGVSDPGEHLVQQAIAAGITVSPVPGPTALVTALVASGLPTGRFVFEGFLPREGRLRRRALKALQSEGRTVVLYEAPHRLLETLGDLLVIWGPTRRGVVARELTKVHEEFVRGTIRELHAHFECCAPRGEIVLILEGAEEVAEQPKAGFEEVLQRELLGGAKVADAVKSVMKSHGVKRDLLYGLALAWKKSQTKPD